VRLVLILVALSLSGCAWFRCPVCSPAACPSAPACVPAPVVIQPPAPVIKIVPPPPVSIPPPPLAPKAEP